MGKTPSVKNIKINKHLNIDFHEDLIYNLDFVIYVSVSGKVNMRYYRSSGSTEHMIPPMVMPYFIIKNISIKYKESFMEFAKDYVNRKYYDPLDEKFLLDFKEYANIYSDKFRDFIVEGG